MNEQNRKIPEDVSEELLEKAIAVATAAHEGQTDKAGKPYILHPSAVAASLGRNDEKIVGYLHDVMEDTDVTEAQLRPVFGDRITDALLLLTHDEKIPYMDYVRNIKDNELARQVKMADLRHNMDLGRLPVVREKDLARVEKYKKALQLLME